MSDPAGDRPAPRSAVPVVRWALPDPSIVAAVLARIGLSGRSRREPAADDERLVPLANAWLSLERAAGARSPWGRLVAVDRGGGRLRRPAPAHAAPGDGVRLVGIGWATVDVARSASELGARRLDPRPPDEALGAHAARATDFVPDENPEEDRSWLVNGPELVLLEPSTEGRIAASLARFGEGPAALYIAPSVVRAGALTGRPSAPTAGPFGRQHLVVGGPVEGPHLVLVDGNRPGTIGR